ncbi:MAG: hypothetical protein UY48_C0042G0008 [Candidatus Gottesmanbacteria bacterium GW2011_GWB1_49_7]|uniref:Uncharacterized protein n=1 Tax=Candidatus Gottesmanbacteria bacterium GW2011_GWB1_49_7 TaxID=1618448 RepID=A0A0G1VUZ3_9BACT|nr:MAG: hypothetical protein UY48_C0042G0008 [Candidatus Gottesmanbacteria bacterium GW2011_GWB1_49_7]
MHTLPDDVVNAMRQENESLKEQLDAANAKLAEENTAICRLMEQSVELRCERDVAIARAEGGKEHTQALEKWALEVCEALHNLLSLARPHSSNDGVWPYTIKAAEAALDNDVISYRQI